MIFKEKEEPQVGMRIEVFWPLEKKYFSGKINDYDAGTGKHLVAYDDGDSEKLNLDKEKWNVVRQEEKSAPNTVFCTNVVEDYCFDSATDKCIKDLFQAGHRLGDHLFDECRRMELRGLLEKSVFEPVHKSEAAGRVFGSRFVDEVKH